MPMLSRVRAHQGSQDRVAPHRPQVPALCSIALQLLYTVTRNDGLLMRASRVLTLAPTCTRGHTCPSFNIDGSRPHSSSLTGNWFVCVSLFNISSMLPTSCAHCHRMHNLHAKSKYSLLSATGTAERRPAPGAQTRSSTKVIVYILLQGAKPNARVLGAKASPTQQTH